LIGYIKIRILNLEWIVNTKKHRGFIVVQFPDIQWVQQDPAIDPSGLRDALIGGAGFLKLLSTAAGAVLDFGQLNTTGSGGITDTSLAYARINDMGDASGVFNMRMFLTNITAWGAGTYRFLEQKHLHFVSNLTLDSSAINTPTVIPSSPNLSGTIIEPEWPLGKPWMSGLLDSDVSQYVHLAVEVGVDVPVGTYGGAGAGSFRYRLLYDFS